MEQANYRLSTPNETSEVREWASASFNAKVACACKQCNNGWMSRLEARAKPLLEPIILGKRQVLLDQKAQTLFATWAVLRTFVFHELTRTRDIPAEHYQYLFKEQQPPPNTIVWIGAYSEPAVAAGFSNETGIPASEADNFPSGAKVYASALTAGNLVMRVSGHNLDIDATILDRTFGQALIRIWPNPEEVTWPPRLALDAKGAAALEKAFQLGHQSVFRKTTIVAP
jgi:hypothetical protein